MIKILFGTLILSISPLLFAEELQSLDLLRNKIEQQVLNELASYAQGKVQVSADKIDPRLQLKPCSEAKLEVFNPYQTPILNTNTMGIKCQESDNHWTLYVPVKITLLKSVYVAKHLLMRGEPIKEEDIYQTELDTQKLKQGFFTDKNDIIGQVCKQSVAADTPLTPFHVELAKLVHRGEQVSIVAIKDNLSISMQGIALDTGALGEHIKVKNLSSKRVIEATVMDREKVEVIL